MYNNLIGIKITKINKSRLCIIVLCLYLLVILIDSILFVICLHDTVVVVNLGIRVFNKAQWVMLVPPLNNRNNIK